MAEIRPCTPDDVPAVADLFQRVFARSAGPAPAALGASMREEFFGHPAFEPDNASRVYVAPDGAVRGFIGVHPLRMSFRGRVIRAAVAGSLMVDRALGDPLAGARLLRSFVNGPQELSISETANPVSQAMWEKLGGRSAPLYSMEWVRVLRPAGMILAGLSAAVPALRFSRPVWSVADWAALRLAGDWLQAGPATFASDADADLGFLREHLPAFAEQFPLRPDWDAATLDWLLRQAARKECYGALHARAVHGRGGKLLGLYVYHGRPGGVGRVLQVMALPGEAKPVVESLVHHAAARGSVALRGRTQPGLMDALMAQRCLFLHRSSTMAHSRQPDLLDAIRAGDALINGLAGETWTRLIGGRFAAA